ncbi:MAG TPA: nuclear transport factor 2 family protein [Gemmatimonadales bacterium]|nr:nuclear transport factor 2 family protein [Gemmatimonadales bacterium]
MDTRTDCHPCHPGGVEKPARRIRHSSPPARGDSINIRSSDAYAAGFNGKPAADESARKRRIVSVDISGTAAIAKIELDYPQTKFIDYMALLKIKGEWRIAAKAFDAQPK